jgi:pyruvate,water dikinase
MSKKKSARNILWFKEISKDDIPLVGGKAANLGELVRAGIPVPNGFAVTSKAYFDFLKKSALREKIKIELTDLDVSSNKKLRRASQRIKTAILAADLPTELAQEITDAYQRLSGNHDQEVAVRSSATAEDLPGASFAGQQETFLNVLGAENVLAAVQKAWASLFTARAIFYRAEKGFDHFKVGLAVPIQLMIDSEVSGVLFTVDPLTSDPQKISIEAAYGWGDLVVSGEITPDQYTVSKAALQIVDKKIVEQKIWHNRKGKKKVTRYKRKRQKLADKFIVQLAKLGKKIEEHYGFPQDIEWALKKGKVWIVQSRPVTTIKIKSEKMIVDESEVDEKLLLVGSGASPGVGIGPVKIVLNPAKLNRVKEGDVLVTEMTNPDFVPAMRRAAAIVTDRGGQTSHAAIVSRELGIPAVVGTTQATTMLKNGEMVTVDGHNGKVYRGRVSKDELEPLASPFGRASGDFTTATKLYVNLSQPELAIEVAKQNVDGVGLLRSEFLIAKIGIHPRLQIEMGESRKFIDQLAEDVGKFCSEFTPRPVVYRATDFKSSEYRNLKGGKKFEVEEPNPLLGFRGALRFVTDEEVFRLELKALKKVKNKLGYRNLILMIPFVRTPEELQKVKHILVKEGLRRSGIFKLWMMVEIPANVVMLDEFAKVGIDGISIGSNDLTMLTLGADRDNERVAGDFNELNPAVLWMLEQAIKKARKLKLTSSICGQAPSQYPELIEKLVKWGITSISVNPDAIVKSRQLIYEAEKKVIKG